MRLRISERIDMTHATAGLVVLFLVFVTWVSCDDRLPVVINTWPFLDANKGGEYIHVLVERGRGGGVTS